MDEVTVRNDVTPFHSFWEYSQAKNVADQMYLRDKSGLKLSHGDRKECALLLLRIARYEIDHVIVKP